MRASEISFEELRVLASGKPELSVLMSYIQVENGINDLKASWQGFSDSSDYYGERFTNKHHICSEFRRRLSEFIELQPISN